MFCTSQVRLVQAIAFDEAGNKGVASNRIRRLNKVLFPFIAQTEGYKENGTTTGSQPFSAGAAYGVERSELIFIIMPLPSGTFAKHIEHNKFTINNAIVSVRARFESPRNNPEAIKKCQR